MSQDPRKLKAKRKESVDTVRLKKDIQKDVGVAFKLHKEASALDDLSPIGKSDVSGKVRQAAEKHARRADARVDTLFNERKKGRKP